MAPLKDPWSMLGISHEADEREIKKAYARLLKTIRPDEDAEGFQSLVEARDVALAFARRPTGQKSAARVPEETEDADADLEWETEPQLFVQELGEAEFVPPSAALKPEPPAIVEEAIDLTAAPAAWAPVPASSPMDEVKFEQLLNDIVAGLDPLADEARLEDAKNSIGKLTGFSATARRAAEARLLPAMVPLLPLISDRLMKGPPRGLGWGASWKRRKDEPNQSRALLQLAFIQQLNEEFGWIQSDRHVYELVGRENGTTLMVYLNAFDRASRVAKASANDRKGWRIRPILDERDARAYFGDTYSVYAPLLTKLRSRTSLPVQWRTRIFLLLPLWLLGGRHYRLFLFWLAAFCIAITATQLNTFPQSWLNPAGTHGLPVIALIGCLPLLALHVWAGAYGYRWELNRALSKIAEADRKGLFDPSMRTAFLNRVSVYRSSARPRNTWRVSWWFIGVIAYALIRALITLSQHH